MLEAATQSVAISVTILALLCSVIGVLLLVIWSIKRHPKPHLQIECAAPLNDLLRSLSGLTQSAIYEGNTVELLHNGAFFDVLIDGMREAKSSLHFETFLWKEGALGTRVADALCERARAGVKVRVLLDATGTKKMGKDVARRLKDAGCRVVKYHPRYPRNIGVLNHRDHRKIVVIDGHVAFAGGHCIVDEWLGDAQDRKHVRDMGVRVRGPIVHAIQSVFAENWIEESGELFAGDDVFPELEPVGNVAGHVAHLKPEGSAPTVKILHHMAICTAKNRLWIQNPYFLPDPEAIEAFGEAVKRGVDVRVMVPSAEASDMPIVQHAAHRNFEKLLECGVRLLEYPKTLLHQKVMVVDGVWSAIGSTNFDDRAFEINEEITLGFSDRALAAELEAVFERDAKDCHEIELEKWRARGAFHKLKDNFYYLFNEQL
jgi:cardiolipin synthase